jgi:hypothetical protein
MTAPPDVNPTASDSCQARDRFWLRIFWVAVQLVMVFWFAQRGNLFFYQRF